MRVRCMPLLGAAEPDQHPPGADKRAKQKQYGLPHTAENVRDRLFPAPPTELENVPNHDRGKKNHADGELSQR